MNKIVLPQTANTNSPALNAMKDAQTLVKGEGSVAKGAEKATDENSFEKALKEGLEKKAVKDAVLGQVPAQAQVQAQPQLPVQGTKAEVKANEFQAAPELKLGNGQEKVTTKKTGIANPVIAGEQAFQPVATQNPVSAQGQVPAKNAQAEATQAQAKGVQVTAHQNAQSNASAQDAQLKTLLLQPQVLQAQVPQTSAPQTGAKVSNQSKLASELGGLTEGSSEFDHDFEVDSLDVKHAKFEAARDENLSTFNQKDLSTKRAPTSKLSTSDYLNLRQNPQTANFGTQAIGVQKGEQKRGKLELVTEKGGVAGLSPFANPLQNHSNIKTLDAQVTQGGSGKTVMTHDAIHQIASQVNLMSQAKQDGEIKIRLRPDHLGELHMSVKAQGQQIAIEIKAQSHEAKKIIEESLSSLRDSLSQQNLNLSRIDVVTPTNQAQTNDQGMQMDLGQFRQNSGDQSRGFNDQGGQSSARQDRLYEDSISQGNLNSARNARPASRTSDGLDLIA